MPSDREERIAEFAKPFRVAPGSKVSLEKDFDPTFKTGVSSKKEGRKLLARGIELLAEYQSRALRPGHPWRTHRAPSARRSRKGRNDSTCDEWRQPAGRVGAQLQGSLE